MDIGDKVWYFRDESHLGYGKRKRLAEGHVVSRDVGKACVGTKVFGYMEHIQIVDSDNVFDSIEKAKIKQTKLEKEGFVIWV